MPAANKRKNFFKERKKYSPVSLQNGTMSGLTPWTFILAAYNSALASLPPHTEPKAQQDMKASSLLRPLPSMCVSLLVCTWLSWFPGIHRSFQKLYSHIGLSQSLLSQASWSITCPRCCSRPLRPVPVPLNAFSKSHLESHDSPGDALSEEIGSLSTCPWERHHPDSWTPTATLLENKFYIASSGTSNQHLTFGHHSYGHFKMPQHSHHKAAVSLFKLSPCFQFLTRFPSSSKADSDSFCQFISCTGRGTQPWISLFYIFGSPAPFEHSVFGENSCMESKDPQGGGQGLVSPGSFQPVVHLDPTKIGPVSQKYIKKNKHMKEQRVLLSLRIMCSALALHDL